MHDKNRFYAKDAAEKTDWTLIINLNDRAEEKERILPTTLKCDRQFIDITITICLTH